MENVIKEIRKRINQRKTFKQITNLNQKYKILKTVLL